MASSEGMGTAAGAATEAGAVAGAAAAEEPESCTGGLGASEMGGEAAAAGLVFSHFKRKHC